MIAHLSPHPLCAPFIASLSLAMSGTATQTEHATEAVLILSLLCAVIPAILFCVNLRDYAEPPQPTPDLPAVSILIPARNEAGVIHHAITHALTTRKIDFEIVIMDDASTDTTAAIVLAIAAQHPRVRLEQAPPLPAGWNGKQHACWSLAQAARNPILCFVDADVTLGPDVIARMAHFLHISPTKGLGAPSQAVSSLEVGSQKSLVSGFPRQTTVTTLEWLLLPLIHFVLLGFLPISRMRAGNREGKPDPAFAAGCGQFMMVRREAYFATGGHSQIRTTMHDGLLLPRLFRAAGHRTDLADITNLASCRMYTTAGQVWSGLAKNATEGIANPKRILPISLILLLGQVLPFVPLAILLYYLPWIIDTLRHHSYIVGVDHAGMFILPGILIALTASWLPRWLAVPRFKQDWRSALLHPLGILLLLAIQWYALLRKLRGGPTSWRGRAYIPPKP